MRKPGSGSKDWAFGGCLVGAMALGAGEPVHFGHRIGWKNDPPSWSLQERWHCTSMIILSFEYASCGEKQKLWHIKELQLDLVICGLFICKFVYLKLQIDHFSGTYPPIYNHSWSFYMQIHYRRAWFFGPYLSHITRSNCTVEFRVRDVYL